MTLNALLEGNGRLLFCGACFSILFSASVLQKHMSNREMLLVVVLTSHMPVVHHLKKKL